jgi:cation diffusion facilitator CzcD-associated flavoprotein CzcO
MLAGRGWRTDTPAALVVCYLSFLLSIVSDHRQDIPAHTYQASFEPNKEWSSFYAAAPEIHKYWKRVVDKYGCMEYVKLRSQVIGAVWDEDEGKWRLKVGIQSGRQHRTSTDARFRSKILPVTLYTRINAMY